MTEFEYNGVIKCAGCKHYDSSRIYGGWGEPNTFLYLRETRCRIHGDMPNAVLRCPDYEKEEKP